jgi:hypothetical protein
MTFSGFLDNAQLPPSYLGEFPALTCRIEPLLAKANQSLSVFAVQPNQAVRHHVFVVPSVSIVVWAHCLSSDDVHFRSICFCHFIETLPESEEACG